MIDAATVEKKIRTRYQDLERVTDGIFRAVDRHANRTYAIRYFDLNDQLIRTANSLRKYQEDVLSDTYFSSQTAIDLRWNHYVYFVISPAASQSEDFSRAKLSVEADREYARKRVLLEEEIDSLLTQEAASFQTMPDDLASIWMKRLEEKGLAYVLDEDVSVPEATRLITRGNKKRVENVLKPLDLEPAERAAAQHFLKNLAITGFRTFPRVKEHTFGRVNLIVGANGVGKTSLLEAIEYLFCGQTNRPSELTGRTCMSASFVGSNEKFITSTDTIPQQLRNRHSHWYAKSETKTLTLSKSFGKFNFLDSDAAVHLSIDKNDEQIGLDVARLLLGSEAEKLSDRLQRVKAKIEEFVKDRRRDVTTNYRLLQEASGRLQTLQRTPQVSDALFMELTTALKQLNWRAPPVTKHGAETVREALQSAVSLTKVLASSNMDILASEDKSLWDRQKALTQAVEFATGLIERQNAATLSLAQTNRSQEALRARLAALDALLPYVEMDYQKVSNTFREVGNRVELLTMRLKSFGNDELGVGLDNVLDHPLRVATETAHAVLTERGQRLAEAQRALKVMRDTHSTVSVLRQRLLSAAQELLDETPNPDHCPLCHTEFERGQLQVRMLSTVIGTSESQLTELQTVVRFTEQELTQAQLRSSTLSRLMTFVENQGAGTVAEAIEAVIKTQQNLAVERNRLTELETRFQGFSTSGLSEQELSRQLTSAGLEELVEAPELARRKAEITEDLTHKARTLDSLRETLEPVTNACEQLASSFGISPQLDTKGTRRRTVCTS